MSISLHPTMPRNWRAHRKICASKLSGVREFETTGIKVVTGCTSIPAPKSMFCQEHQDTESPALLSSQVSKSTRLSLRDHRMNTAASSEASQDNIYVMDSLHLFVKNLNFPICLEIKKTHCWDLGWCLPLCNHHSLWGALWQRES